MTTECYAFGFKFNIFLNLNCTDNISCYNVGLKYGKAYLNKTELLTLNNGLLYSNQRSAYLGTQCNDWYTEAQKIYANRKLNATGTNWISIQYTAPIDSNYHANSRIDIAPTCGVVRYREYRAGHAYGYGRLYRVTGGATHIYCGDITCEMNNGYPFNGGSGWYFNKPVPVLKGDSLQIGAHYGATSYLNAGY